MELCLLYLGLLSPSSSLGVALPGFIVAVGGGWELKPNGVKGSGQVRAKETYTVRSENWSEGQMLSPTLR